MEYHLLEKVNFTHKSILEAIRAYPKSGYDSNTDAVSQDFPDKLLVGSTVIFLSRYNFYSLYIQRYQRNMSKSFSSGYHDIRDYHYFTFSPTGARFLGLFQGTDEDYKTYDSFLGLITSVHESYHVMQNFLLGFNNWRAFANDNFVWSVCNIFRETLPQKLVIKFPLLILPKEYNVNFEEDILNASCKNPFEKAKKALCEKLFIDAQMDSLDMVRMLLKGVSCYCEEVQDLTIRDLLECHAAILTELHISRAIKLYPNLFNDSIVKDLSDSFCVHMMPKYNKVITVFEKEIEKYLNFDIANSQHYLYPQCKQAAKLELILFLLDFSLHIPYIYSIVEEGKFWDPYAKEDFFPTSRYLKLLVSFMMVKIEDLRNNRNTYTNFFELYSKTCDQMVFYINEHNKQIRKQDKEKITFFSVFDAIAFLNSLDLPDTFLNFRSVTESWLNILASNPMHLKYPRLYEMRKKAMGLRLKEPWHWFKLHPLHFFSQIDFPTPYFRTPSGLKMGLPGFSVNQERIDANTVSILENWIKDFEKKLESGLPLDEEDLSSEIQIEDKSGNIIFKAPGLPYSLIDDFISHEILISLAEMLFHQGVMKCPLSTDRLNFYPCNSKNEKCQYITELNKLPLMNCLVRSSLSKNFCEAEYLENQWSAM